MPECCWKNVLQAYETKIKHYDLNGKCYVYRGKNSAFQLILSVKHGGGISQNDLPQLMEQ